MISLRSRRRTRFGRSMRAAIAVLLVAILIGIPTTSAAAQDPPLNAAGLVIKHGDGSVLYFFIPFSEPAITGTQLLQRAGVAIDVAPFAGIGQAVCRIDGEGCPSSNCFCKSYANPSVYWRYHKLASDGSWVTLPYGPDQRTIHNGDVDGWSWSAQSNDLPKVTLAEIAQMNGIETSSSTPSSTPTPRPTEIATDQPQTGQAAVSPVVSGVEVKSSGKTAPVHPVEKQHESRASSFVWFGVGILLMLLIGAMIVVRRWKAES